MNSVKKTCGPASNFGFWPFDRGITRYYLNVGRYKHFIQKLICKPIAQVSPGIIRTKGDTNMLLTNLFVNLFPIKPIQIISGRKLMLTGVV
jgi:hypothetical protein